MVWGMKLLLRYDTEATHAPDLQGFLATAVDVHRRHRIPATFFCTGGAIDARASEFREFAAATRDDHLFDIQDHSYTHIGIGYRDGHRLEKLSDDFERSFAAHERVIGRRPFGISICGVPDSGPRLRGFDDTPKARAELAMLVRLGVRMINAFRGGVREGRSFCDFAALGHPEVMGFPSANSDTSWMWKQDPRVGLDGMLREIDQAGRERRHLCVMLHDWVAWKFALDRRLSHVVEIAERARRAGFELVTHAQCYAQRALWATR
jgi:peptidoglycan/xylan/chitin deacetylase (PgdA/CDA1 family)